MKTIYELNEKDIVSVVAERFDIDPDFVTVSYRRITNSEVIDKLVIRVTIKMEQEVDDVV